MKLTRKLNEQEILDCIKSKSKRNQAISELYSAHYGLLEHYIIQNSGSADDAADVIQEVMLVFVKLVSEEKYRGEASIKSLLYSICKNLWITELRKRKTTGARNERYEGEKEQMENDISTQISKNENLKFVMDLFDKLGEKCKQILTLFYFEELPMKEISDKLDFSSEQVLRNKKYKCLQSLTDQVKSSPVLSKNLQKALRHE